MVTASDDVGVVGTADAVVDALRDAAAAVVVGDAETVRDAAPDWVVAVGEPALLDLVAAGVDAPILPVDAGGGVRSVPRDRAGAAVESVAGGRADRAGRQLLSVDVDGERLGRAALDVLLVTDEAARISEYAVTAGGDGVAQFRADGVVVATPAGSVGYPGDAGGPVVFPGTGSLAVVPVAPFVTDADHWIVDDDSVTLGVKRRERVAVVVDGRERRVVGRGTEVAVTAADRLSLLVAPESPPGHGGELEKH